MTSTLLETTSIPLACRDTTIGDLTSPEMAEEWVAQLRQKSWFKNCDVKLMGDRVQDQRADVN